MIADCLYHGEYGSPENWGGVCVASREVPAGCPVDVMVRHDAPSFAIDPVVYRGNQQLAVTPTRTVDATVTAMIRTIDVYSCDCAHVTAQVPFDRVVLSFPGLAAGDAISFEGTGNAESASVAITAAGPCPAPMWPTYFEQLTACDLCPIDPTDPPGTEHDGGGCSASPGAGLLVAAAALLARLTRR